MVWKQLTSLMWVNDDGVMLKLYRKTQQGTGRYTEFYLASIFNTRTKVHLATTVNANEKKEVLDFILNGKDTHLIGAGDWSRALNDLNQQRKLYFDFEEENRGSFYNINYQKCF
jgi:hypothetical protein